MRACRVLWLLLAFEPIFRPAFSLNVAEDADLTKLDTLWSSVQVYEQLAASASIQCRNHTRNMLDSLRNATFWAVQMVDSSANIPSGVLEGNIYNFGDFDECLSIDTGTIQGQYCLASLQIDGPKLDGLRSRPVQDARLRPYSFLNTWYHIQDRGERWRAPRDTVKLAMCVPKSCSYLEVRNAMTSVYNSKISVLNATVHIDLPEKLCSTYEPMKISSLDIAFLSIIGILVLLTISSTMYNIFLKRNPGRETSIPEKLYLCYDLRTNFLNLSNMEKESDTDLNFLFGIRLFSILTVIICHKAGFTTAGPTKNPNFQEQTYSQLQYMPLLHADLVVDTFFFLAGFLLTVGMLKVLKRPISGMKVSVWPLYVFRYLRLTPAYMLTILFYVSLLPKIGSGPLWKVTVVPESEFCLENWWTNLAYINNYVHVERSCIEQGWYMPCDMHLFIVCAPLVLLLHRRPKIGFALLTLFTFASLLAPFLAIYILDTDPMLLFFFDFLRGSRIHTYFSTLYVKSHFRGSPYFIGVIIGLIYMSKRKTRLAKAKSLPLLLIGFVIGLATSLSAALFYYTEGAAATSRLSRAFYGALHRATWALSVGLVVLAISLGRIGFWRKFLGWKPFVPFSKLSYGAYLIHIVVLWYSAGTAREANYNNSYFVILRTLGDTVITFVAALFLYLMVEVPIRDMAKVALRASVGEIKQDGMSESRNVVEEMHSSEMASQGFSSVPSSDSGVCAISTSYININKESAICAL